MHVIIFVVIFQICQVIYMGCLRGAGDTLYTAIASTISVTIIRTVVSYLFGYTASSESGWASSVIRFHGLSSQPYASNRESGCRLRFSLRYLSCSESYC